MRGEVVLRIVLDVDTIRFAIVGIAKPYKQGVDCQASECRTAADTRILHRQEFGARHRVTDDPYANPQIAALAKALVAVGKGVTVRA